MKAVRVNASAQADDDGGGEKFTEQTLGYVRAHVYSFTFQR